MVKVGDVRNADLSDWTKAHRLIAKACPEGKLLGAQGGQGRILLHRRFAQSGCCAPVPTVPEGLQAVQALLQCCRRTAFPKRNPGIPSGSGRKAPGTITDTYNPFARF